MHRRSASFSPWDYVVFALVLAVSAGIGIFYACSGGKQKTTKEFLMADRQMGILPVGLSLLASFMSAITLLGTPTEMYVYGTQYWMIWLSYCLMIPLANYVFIPIFYNLQLTSAYEYLEMRFNKAVRTVGALTFTFQMALYMSIVLYAPSLALNAVTGLNVYISVFSVGLVCTFYTTLGGMKAVMWTDVFQICMMFAGLFAVIIKGSVDHGGFQNVWKIAEQGQRIEFFNFDPNPLVRHTTWSLVIGGTFTWLAIYGVNQAQVQRCLTCPTLKKAQRAMWMNLPGLAGLLTIVCMCGLVVYAEFRDCDPKTHGDILANDQLLPLYVMNKLGQFPGLPGLFIACLFSGALSTISSGLNSLAAVCLQDLIRNTCFQNLSEERSTTVSKFLALGFGVVSILLTFVAEQLGGVLQAALALFGMIGGPLLGIFTLGVLYPWANSIGALTGYSVSMVLMFWIGIGANIIKPIIPEAPISIAGCPVDNSTLSTTLTAVSTAMLTTADPAADRPPIAKLYEISYMWYSALAVLIVTVVGLPVSFISGPNHPSEVDPRLISPIFDIFCCYLPEKVKKVLRCNIIHKDKFKDEANQEKPLDMKSSTETLENGYTNPVALSPDSKSSSDITLWVTPM